MTAHDQIDFICSIVPAAPAVYPIDSFGGRKVDIGFHPHSNIP